MQMNDYWFQKRIFKDSVKVRNEINKSQTSLVALVRTDNRIAGVTKAIKLPGLNPVMGKAVALKPNFNTADPFPASTHNDTLRTLIVNLQQMGATKIVVADRSGPAETRRVIQEKGIFEMAKELGFQAIQYDLLIVC
jgi:uncharacterized protein (DUF362 family)